MSGLSGNETAFPTTVPVPSVPRVALHLTVSLTPPLIPTPHFILHLMCCILKLPPCQIPLMPLCSVSLENIDDMLVIKLHLETAENTWCDAQNSVTSADTFFLICNIDVYSLDESPHMKYTKQHIVHCILRLYHF